jgi:hypothetical protein
MTARYNGLADGYDARFVVGAPRQLPSLPEPHALAIKARRN